MKHVELTKPLGFLVHVTGLIGAGKTALIGDMLAHEQKKGKCAYLFTRREGNELGGGWSVLPQEVLDPSSNTEIIYLEDIKDVDELYKKWRKEPLQAIGVDTSMGLELLIRTAVTGDENQALKSSLKDPQHKIFKDKLCLYVDSLRDMAKYTMMVSPATPTSYNPENASYDVGLSGSSVDADKRFTPDGENNDSKLKLLYLCDYAFHIQLIENERGDITGRQLKMQPSLKLMTKSRVPIGKQLESIRLDKQPGTNWEQVKHQIDGVFNG